jgi:hypothetical protein
VGEGLVEIAGAYPEARSECVAALARPLERFAENDPTFNGGVIGCLAHLKAVEAAPLMERAFAAGKVDEFICGGWEEIRYELGLRADPPPRRFYNHLTGTIEEAPDRRRGKPRTPKQRAQARRKQAGKSRRHNRKNP